ncbi:MAG: hypothetical protein AAF998_25285 [Bacteroidota bacterium]
MEANRKSLHEIRIFFKYIYNRLKISTLFFAIGPGALCLEAGNSGFGQLWSVETAPKYGGELAGCEHPVEIALEKMFSFGGGQN